MTDEPGKRLRCANDHQDVEEVANAKASAKNGKKSGIRFLQMPGSVETILLKCGVSGVLSCEGAGNASQTDSPSRQDESR